MRIGNQVDLTLYLVTDSTYHTTEDVYKRQIYETETPKAWVGKTIHQLDIRRKYNVTLLAVKKDDQINPEIHSDYCFKEDETLLVLGKNKNVQKCFHI